MITEVEIRPQIVGYRLVDGVQEDVASEDFAVLMGNYGENGKMRQIGYVWFKPRKFLSFDCIRVSKEEQERIKLLCEETLGETFEKVTQPPEVEEDEEDDDDE